MALLHFAVVFFQMSLVTLLLKVTTVAHVASPWRHMYWLQLALSWPWLLCSLWWSYTKLTGTSSIVIITNTCVIIMDSNRLKLKRLNDAEMVRCSFLGKRMENDHPFSSTRMIYQARQIFISGTCNAISATYLRLKAYLWINLWTTLSNTTPSVVVIYMVFAPERQSPWLSSYIFGFYRYVFSLWIFYNVVSCIVDS